MKLFNLIKNLDKSEKRYFKLYGQRHVLGSQNKYVQLFEILEAQSDYAEQEIFALMQKKGLQTDFFAADKYYLYGLILRCLNEFHHDKTYNLKLKSDLQSIEILFLKGFYEDALKLINKAEKNAHDAENYYLLTDILQWKKKCFGYTQGLLKAYQVNIELKSAIEKLHNLQQLTDLYYQSYVLRFREEKTESEQVKAEFGELMQNPLLNSPENALTLPAKVFYYLIFSHFYFVIDESEKELYALQTLIDLIHRSKIYRFENPLDYIAVYFRLLSLKKFIADDSFCLDLEMLRDFAAQRHIQSEIIRERVFVFTYSNELEFLLIKGDYQKAVKKIAETDAGIAEQKTAIEPFYLMYFFYMYAVVLIIVGKQDKALTNINKVLNDFSYEDRPQIFVKAEILNLIIHFELGNYDYFCTLFKNVSRKYKKEQFYGSFERALLKKLFFIAEKVPTSHSQITKPLQKFLNQIEQEMPEKLLKYSNQTYLKWVKAKIAGKSVSDYAGK